MPIRWKPAFLVIAATLAAASIVVLLATRGSASPRAAEVEFQLKRALKPGDTVDTACAVLQSVHATTTCELHDGQRLIASIGQEQSAWRLVRRSVRVEILFDPEGGLSRIDCRDIYTGP
jgi:hypothetical protein